MTTMTTFSPIEHTSDATFRAWAQEYHDLLVGVGLVQTSDTGQVDLSTAVRPGINANAGYRIYRMNDSLQATRPIFIRVDYGTGSAVANGRVLVTIGTGSNGAGAITGVSENAVNLGGSDNNGFGPTARHSYAAGGEGYFWIAFKVGAANTVGTPRSSFGVFRSANLLGTPTADAVLLLLAGDTGPATNYCRQLLYNPSSSSSSGACGLVPLGRPSSVIQGADVQVWRTYHATPRQRVNPFLFITNRLDIPQGQTRTLAAAAGHPARTYISVGQGLGSGFPGNGQTYIGGTSSNENTFMPIWE